MKQFNKTTVLFVAAVLTLLIAPILIFGTDSYITVHDNLDNNIPILKYISDIPLFPLDRELSVLDGISLVFFRNCFTLCSLIFKTFPIFTAYAINYILAILFGLFSMYKLLTIVFKDGSRNILLAVSLLYAMLPVFPCWSLSCSLLPLSPLLFYYTYTRREWYWVALALFLPFILDFAANTPFVCGLWLVGLIAVSIKDKKLNMRLLTSFILLCIGVVIFNIGLFYMVFVLKEDLNRAHFTIDPTNFLKGFHWYFISGYYHAASLQMRIILPIVSLFIMFLTLSRVKFCRSFCSKIDFDFSKVKREYIICAICLSVAFFFGVVAALDEALLFNWLKDIITPLKGFSFARLFILNRPLWYVAFAAVLLSVYKCRKFRFIAPCLILLQTCNILTASTQYNDSFRSLYYHITQKPGTNAVTWKEFYDTELFNQIKEDIDYKGEPTLGVGFHSNLMLYNDFNVVDGYISVYPYKDMLKFRRIIAPELDVNLEKREYYDTWGGRRYAYCSELDYTETREKDHEPVTLRINTDVFKNEFNGKYIFSRAELKNAAELNLTLVGHYTHEKSIYNMYVYSVN